MGKAVTEIAEGLGEQGATPWLLLKNLNPLLH